MLLSYSEYFYELALGVKAYIALRFLCGSMDVLTHPALQIFKPSGIFIRLGFRLHFKCCVPEQLFKGYFFHPDEKKIQAETLKFQALKSQYQKHTTLAEYVRH